MVEVIKITNLRKRFDLDDPEVIRGMNFEIKEGEYVSLMGRSGSGKSTLMYLLSSLDRDYQGTIHYDGVELKTLDVEAVHRLRNEQIGFVFQFHYLLNELSALENVLLPLRRSGALKKKSRSCLA